MKILEMKPIVAPIMTIYLPAAISEKIKWCIADIKEYPNKRISNRERSPGRNRAIKMKDKVTMDKTTPNIVTLSFQREVIFIQKM